MNGPVRVVAQRVNRAELKGVGTIERGLVVFVSFNAALGDHDTQLVKETCERAALAVLTVPLLSMGQWGDGSKPEGLLKLLAKHEGEKLGELVVPTSPHTVGEMPNLFCATGVLVVPQANLHATRKGKSALSYRSQLGKERAREAYDAFCRGLRQALSEAGSTNEKVLWVSHLINAHAARPFVARPLRPVDRGACCSLTIVALVLLRHNA